MDEPEGDVGRELMLDGNAVGGLLHDMFAREMTVAPAECASCGTESPMGRLLAFTQAPGVVLRCPGCNAIVLRVVMTSSAIHLDARGAASITLHRRE